MNENCIEELSENTHENTHKRKVFPKKIKIKREKIKMKNQWKQWNEMKSAVWIAISKLNLYKKKPTHTHKPTFITQINGTLNNFK